MASEPLPDPCDLRFDQVELLGDAIALRLGAQSLAYARDERRLRLRAAIKQIARVLRVLLKLLLALDHLDDDPPGLLDVLRLLYFLGQGDVQRVCRRGRIGATAEHIFERG